MAKKSRAKTSTATSTTDSMTTKLVTSLTYLGAGPSALADLQNRLDRLTGKDKRIVLGEIKTDGKGQPVCGVSFNCDSYDPPVNGNPDPRAIADLREALGQINLDGCVLWSTIELLTE